MSWNPPETDAHRPRRTGRNTGKRDRETCGKDRRIMHVDMDAFFAAIEQRDQPQLRGKPVVVGGIPGGRGVVSTCSYEAREYGVRSGMSTAEAARRCPQAVFLRTNGKKYIHASIVILTIFSRYTPVVEPVSIDEAYLDVTGSIRLYRNERALALAVKREIREKLGLSCSIGIAPTRAFAKLASGLNKPDGLTIFTREDLERKIYPLPVEKLWGVGEKTAAALGKLGITSIGELAGCPAARLKGAFGIYGEQLQKVARGESGAAVTPADKREDE